MRYSFLIKGLVIVILLLFIGMVANPSASLLTIKKPIKKMMNGETWYVGGSGPDNETCIQDAINKSSNGDTVFVYDYSSPYKENLKIFKSINLIGEDKKTTFIEGNYLDNTIYINATGVTVMEFSIINSDNGSSGMLLSGCEGCTIYLNNIKDNYCGIMILDSSNDNLIYNNNFINNFHNAHDEGVNEWSKPFPTGGNFWYDYIDKYPDAKKILWFWDTPYLIDGSRANADDLPHVDLCQYNKVKSNNYNLNMLNWFFERFPHLSLILKNLLRL
jgi:parallel beta-helix repeat protein